MDAMPLPRHIRRRSGRLPLRDAGWEVIGASTARLVRATDRLREQVGAMTGVPGLGCRIALSCAPAAEFPALDDNERYRLRDRRPLRTYRRPGRVGRPARPRDARPTRRHRRRGTTPAEPCDRRCAALPVARSDDRYGASLHPTRHTRAYPRHHGLLQAQRAAPAPERRSGLSLPLRCLPGTGPPAPAIHPGTNSTISLAQPPIAASASCRNSTCRDTSRVGSRCTRSGAWARQCAVRARDSGSTGAAWTRTTPTRCGPSRRSSKSLARYSRMHTSTSGGTKCNCRAAWTSQTCRPPSIRGWCRDCAHSARRRSPGTKRCIRICPAT